MTIICNDFLYFQMEKLDCSNNIVLYDDYWFYSGYLFRPGSIGYIGKRIYVVWKFFFLE